MTNSSFAGNAAVADGPLSKLAKEIHELNKAKGWYAFVREFGTIIALIHTELSEAMEEHRAGHKAREVRFNDSTYADPDNGDWAAMELSASHGFKPEGVGIELADAIIRILDYAAEADLDMDRLIAVKTAYNRTRPYRHGNKVV